MDLDDAELVRRLAARDGIVVYRRHARPGEECPYAELYADGRACPWCEAEQRRREREARQARSST